MVLGAEAVVRFGIVKSLLAQDATVIFPARSLHEIESLNYQMEVGSNGRLITFLTDFTDYEKADAIADAIAEKYGQLDIVVAAFDCGKSESTLSELSHEDWLRMIEENISAYFLAGHMSINIMKRYNKGMFVGITDTDNLVGCAGNAVPSVAASLQIAIARQFYTEIKDSGLKLYHLFVNNVGSLWQAQGNIAGSFAITPEMIGNYIIRLHAGEVEDPDNLFQCFLGKPCEDVQSATFRQKDF